MAKRRNLKKEKAKRNEMHARKFRKSPARNYSKGRQYSDNQQTKSKEDEEEKE